MTTCETCNDTHSMSLRGSLVPCTRCPTPCQECRINGRGAYCAKTPCACACHAIVDRPAPTPAVTPGLDLDAVERAVAGLIDSLLGDRVDIVVAVTDVVTVAPALIAEVRALRAEVAKLNDREVGWRDMVDDERRKRISAEYDARAEIARLTAELAAAREAAQRDRDVAQAMAKAAHDAEEQLAAARAVPADVEAAIEELRRAEEVDARAMTGQSLAARVLAEANLRAAIARAISDATDKRDAEWQKRIAPLHPNRTGDGCDSGDPIDWTFAALMLARIDVESDAHDEGHRAAMRDATAAPATVGGLPATAPVARPISEWHEDHGDALWWRFPIEEPPYCGSPISDDWPGDYHTHWTPIVCPDEPNQRGPLPNGDRRATHRCSKCRGISSHTPGGIPCDECGLVGSMPWGG